MLNVVEPKADDTVCIVGAGAVGFAALMALKLCPTPPKRVIAVDIVPERLELAKKYGATDVINSKEVPDLNAALLEVTGGKGVNGTVETTGRPELVETFLKATAKKGKVVQVGVGQVSWHTPASCYFRFRIFLTYLSSQPKYRLLFFIPSTQVECISAALWEIVSRRILFR